VDFPDDRTESKRNDGLGVGMRGFVADGGDGHTLTWALEQVAIPPGQCLGLSDSGRAFIIEKVK